MIPRRDIFAVLAVYTLFWAAVNLPILASPLGEYPVVDAMWHMEWASMVASGDVLAYSPYFRAPLYPLVLGAVFAVFGASCRTGAITGYFFSLASVYFTYRIAFSAAGRRAALIAAGLLSINGVFLFYSSRMLITPLYIMLLLVSFHLLSKSNPSPMGWLFLGLAAVARPSALLLFPLVLLLHGKKTARWWLFFLPVAAVWAVNWAAGDPGTFISSQGGINLFIGSGPNADGYTAFAPGAVPPPPEGDSLPYHDNVWLASTEPFPDNAAPSEISSHWAGAAVKHAFGTPMNTLRLAMNKCLYLISPVAIPSNYDAYYYRRYSPVLGILAGSPRIPVSGLLVWFLLPGAIAAGLPRKNEWALLLWVLALAGGVIPFFVTARFTLPALPFLLILLVPRFMCRPVAGLRLALPGVFAGVVLAFFTSPVVERGGVNMAFHDGIAHYNAGDVAEAQRLFHMSLETAMKRTDGIDLNGTDALFNLGVIALRRGNPSQAESYWRMALERNPGHAGASAALQGLTR